MALDAMLEVGPGGHFFGAKHTLERYATAFYQPMISDWRNFHQWQAAGSPQAAQKANALWKQALAEYREPYLDPAIAEEIDAFVARRIARGGRDYGFLSSGSLSEALEALVKRAVDQQSFFDKALLFASRLAFGSLVPS